MKITLEGTNQSKGHKVTVDTSEDDMTISNVISDLVKPVLLAYGYQEESIKEYLRTNHD